MSGIDGSPVAPLRVLQVCADRGIAPGSVKGAAQHLRGLAGGLVALGHRVVTVSARGPEGPFPVPVVVRNGTPDPLDASGFDVVYERYSLGATDGFDAARRAGIPFVLEVNAPLVDEATSHRPGTVGPDDVGVERRLLAGADLVITVSHELERWVAGHRSGPVLTVSNGFEPSWFPRPADTGAEPSHALVFLGHPRPWHGADRLPALLTGLADRGLRPGLRIIGGGSGADGIREEARRLGVADRIEITGPLPPAEASALLTGSVIGLAPYPRIDPFYFCPLKIVDYLAAGLPVVASDQGDIGSLVAGAGVVVDPDEDEALVGAVADLLVDPDRRAVLGAAGRARVWDEATWPRVAARTAAAIGALRAVGSGVDR